MTAICTTLKLEGCGRSWAGGALGFIVCRFTLSSCWRACILCLRNNFGPLSGEPMGGCVFNGCAFAQVLLSLKNLKPANNTYTQQFEITCRPRFVCGSLAWCVLYFIYRGSALRMGAALSAAPICKCANLSQILSLKRISSNPWHSGAPGGLHDTSDGRQGLMSTIRGCSPLYRCSESILAHNMRTYTHARTRTHARTHARPRTLTHTRTRTLPVAKLSEFPFLFLFVNMSSHFGHSIFAKRARSWKRMYSQYCLSSTEFHARARCGLSAGLYSLSFGALLSR